MSIKFCVITDQSEETVQNICIRQNNCSIDRNLNYITVMINQDRLFPLSWKPDNVRYFEEELTSVETPLGRRIYKTQVREF